MTGEAIARHMLKEGMGSKDTGGLNKMPRATTTRIATSGGDGQVLSLGQQEGRHSRHHFDHPISVPWLLFPGSWKESTY